MTDGAPSRQPKTGRPPGPRGAPLLGSFLAYARDPLGFVASCARAHPRLAFYRLGHIRFYQLNDPELVESVLVGDHRHYVKDAITRMLITVVGHGLLTSEGDLWRRQRRLAAPFLQRRHVEAYARTMVDCAERATDAIEGAGGQPIDAHQAMMGLTLDIVLETLFARRRRGEIAEVAETVEVIMEEFDRDVHSWRYVVPRWFPFPGRIKAKRAVQRLDALLRTINDNRRRQGEEGDDLLGRLLAARHEDGSAMSDRQLRDEMATMYLAGHETTALALFYALRLLAQQPEAQARLQGELDRVLGSEPPTLERLPELRFADAVIQEAMRLYPPAWIIGREATADCEIDGYRLRPGAQVLISQWSMHRDKRWFDDPLAFRPERWLDGLAERLPRFAYFPFGGGPRVCIGNHFAKLEAVLSLASLVRRLSWEPVEGEELKMLPTVTLRPTAGVRLIARPVAS